MLVDTGRLGDINNLFYMLEQRNVKHIKALVITHFDSDHIGGYYKLMEYVKENGITIGNIYARRYHSSILKLLPHEQYFNYIKFLEGIILYQNKSDHLLDMENVTTPSQIRVDVDEVKAAEKANELFGDGNGFWIFPTRTNTNCDFSLASNVSVKWLNRYTTFVKEGESLPGNVNNDSLVFKLTYNETSKPYSMLFVGDIVNNGNADLVANCSEYLDSDILKVSHHGFDYNTRTAFLDKVTPTHSLVTTNNSDNRLASLIEGRESKFGELFYTSEQDNAFCTIAIRRVSPSIYTGDSSLIKYN